MMKITIFKQNAEILSQSVNSVENNRNFGNRTPHLKNPLLLKQKQQNRYAGENRKLSPKS